MITKNERDKIPLISKFYGIKIYINYLDHNPPHVHVYYAEHSALITIVDLKIMEGDIYRRSAKRLVLEWMLKHRCIIVNCSFILWFGFSRKFF
ncbi:DUF4160 domain-containing protein [Leptospira alexanderi]|uniref:DUF4160 domain-containing protein n=1 Tax=Leptospira alexanderi TaxID=100053 RepID=UPI001FD5082F|nr:DUF4160 domain-containing protein [Leptospira alexanderi]